MGMTRVVVEVADGLCYQEVVDAFVNGVKAAGAGARQEEPEAGYLAYGVCAGNGGKCVDKDGNVVGGWYVEAV